MGMGVHVGMGMMWGRASCVIAVKAMAKKCTVLIDTCFVFTPCCAQTSCGFATPYTLARKGCSEEERERLHKDRDFIFKTATEHARTAFRAYFNCTIPVYLANLVSMAIGGCVCFMCPTTFSTWVYCWASGLYA